MKYIAIVVAVVLMATAFGAFTGLALAGPNHWLTGIIVGGCISCVGGIGLGIMAAVEMQETQAESKSRNDKD